MHCLIGVLYIYLLVIHTGVLKFHLHFFMFSFTFTFTFMHLADAFIQSDLQLHSGYTFSLVCFTGISGHCTMCCCF